MKKIVTNYTFFENIIKCESCDYEGKRKCCLRITEELERMRFDVDIFSEYGSPIIYASKNFGKKKNILFYMHYDVKPANRLNEWKTPPFVLSYDSEISKFYARGTGDDKGQIVAAFAGVSEALNRPDMLDYNISFLIEGDEESGSPKLELFVQNELKGKEYDMIIVLDSHWLLDNPVVFLGCRGQMDITIRYEIASMENDYHAGNYGGIYIGAGRELLKIVNELLTQAEDMINQINSMFEEDIKNAISLTYFNSGDEQRSLIPKIATARIDLRYISNNIAETIMNLLDEYSKKYNFLYEIKQKEDSYFNEATKSDLGKIIKAIYTVTKVQPKVINYCGAYLPLKKMQDINGVIYVIPLAQSDENNHAPNENISLKNIVYGTEIIKKILVNDK